MSLILCVLACVWSCADVTKPLDGAFDTWDADRTFWSLEGGELVGRSTATTPLTKSTYALWKGDMPRDFDLRCMIRLTGQGGNSGIHYRSSRVQGQSDLAGFQADLDVANAYTGVLYEGLGRELMSARGQQVEWGPAGKKVLAQFAPDAVLKNAIKTEEWNEYRIQAEGTRVRHWINGVLMSDVTDGDASRFRADGSLAIQLHSGAPMEVRVRNLEIKPIVSAPPPSALIAPAEFTIELLASAQSGQGSWTCITFDSHGRAVISPQQGPLLRAWIPGQSKNHDGTAWSGAHTEVLPLESPLGGAQGLCAVGEDLYVVVAASGESNGLWRARDADHDGTYEEVKQLVRFAGDGGEHGPHGVVQGPDGALYITIGNHTKLTEDLVKYADEHHQGRAFDSPYDFFAEDMIDARMWDPRGHAVGIYAPGGVILRVDPVTARARVLAGGFRNAYDLCFDASGNLFTYDSDMEWDIGAPWYRAPRVVHVVQGGEYGWRSGSGCWPDWYADSLPPACETDSASPTGMLSGHQSAWPEPWKSTLFAADWTYGRILAVTVEGSGSTFTAQWHPWLTGRPMPVTDMAWGPDGQMYMVTGGRGTQSGLYRISHAAVNDAPANRSDHSLRQEREKLQALQVALASTELEQALATMFAALDSPDRWVRFSARAALEHQPVEAWRTRVSALPTARARMEGALALARRGNVNDAPQVVALAQAALGEQSRGNGVNVSDRWVELTAIRAMQVALSRHPELRAAPLGAQAAALGLALAQREYASSGDSPAVWAGLELACGLNSAAAVPLAVTCLAHASDRTTALRYATLLRHTKEGWTDALRQQYWAWLDAANDRAGGFSLSGFIAQVKREAEDNVGRPASAPAAVASNGAPSSARDLPTPGASATSSELHAWTVDELLQPHDATAETRDLARGARLFREATCILCHRFAGEGASTGPDLTGVGARFTRTDLLRAILEPSADVSDQYRDSAIATKDGDMFVGRVVGDSAEAIQVRTNPLSLETERVLKSNITSITPIPTSSMPRGLLDSRSRQEVLDLLEYLERGGGEPVRTMPK